MISCQWRGGLALDTVVARPLRRQGIGARLVAVATHHAREAGCEWLHVDSGDHLGQFYFGSCGFQPTSAGLIRLDGPA